MQNPNDPHVQALLDELTEHSYLVRQKEIAKLLEPYSDSVIPIFVERLDYQGEKYYMDDNAIVMLVILADHRGILPLLRHIEKEGGWPKNIFSLLRETLREKDDRTQKKVTESMIQYLDEGPKIPVPEPDDPVAKGKWFDDWVDYLKQKSGVTEFDEETQKLADEAKERWIQPRDPSLLKEDKFPQYLRVLIEVIDTISEFGASHDPRFEALLSRYIKEHDFDSLITQHALSALGRINPDQADTFLRELSASQGDDLEKIDVRVVSTAWDHGRESCFFNICIQEENQPEWQDRPFLFFHEKGSVFFLARGKEEYKWFAGLAENKSEAIQAAIEYLERWHEHIQTMNEIEGYTYTRVHHDEKYSNLVELLEKHLDLDRWGFKQSYISPKHYPTVIYDSEWCRVKFVLNSGDRYGPDELGVYYGRLHAISNDSFMVFDGEKCWCWHWDFYFLPFLDGVSPQEKAKKYIYSPVIEKYRKSELAQQLSPGPAWGIGKQAAIWEHYGQRLFDLFDLRKPEPWEQYNEFIRELYTIKDRRSFAGHPPMDRIC